MRYENPKKMDYEYYGITQVLLNGKPLKNVALNGKEVWIPRQLFLAEAKKSANILSVLLG